LRAMHTFWSNLAQSRGDLRIVQARKAIDFERINLKFKVRYDGSAIRVSLFNLVTIALGLLR
jgi:hypothetical protein